MFQSVKCPSCSASLKVSANSQDACCEYCGTVVLKHGIYQSSNDAMNENNHIKPSNNLHEQLSRANTFLDLKRYKLAVEIYEQLTKQYPSDWKLWWAFCKCPSCYHDSHLPYLFKEAYENATALASGKDLEIIELEYAAFWNAKFEEWLNKPGMFNKENVFFDNLADPFSKRLEALQKTGWANGKKLNTAMNSLRVLKNNKVPLKKRIAYLQSLVSSPLPSEIVAYFGGADITFAVGYTIIVRQFERTSFALPSKSYYK